MIRLTTRGIRTAEAIRDRVPFTTSGSLRGDVNTDYFIWSGRLRGDDLAQLSNDMYRENTPGKAIDYIVWSYDTPIAWHRTDGTWHIVAQKFSPTTTKHQSNLYLTGCTCSTKHGKGGWSDETGERDPKCPVHRPVDRMTGPMKPPVVRAAENGQALVMDEFNVAGA